MNETRKKKIKTLDKAYTNALIPTFEVTCLSKRISIKIIAIRVRVETITNTKKTVASNLSADGRLLVVSKNSPRTA